MGRAAKLKQRRKLQRLSSPALPTTPTEVVSPSDLEIAQSASDLIDWLLEQWSLIPQLVEDFTLEQARQLANEALYLLLDNVAQEPHRAVDVESKLSDRFTIHLFFKPQPPSIKTLVLDTIDKQAFELTGEFRL